MIVYPKPLDMSRWIKTIVDVDLPIIPANQNAFYCDISPEIDLIFNPVLPQNMEAVHLRGALRDVRSFLLVLSENMRDPNQTHRLPEMAKHCEMMADAIGGEL